MTPDQNRRLALALAAREVAHLAKSGNGPMYCDDDVLAAAGFSATEADALFDKEHPAFEAFNAELSRLAGRLMAEVLGTDVAPSAEQLRAQSHVVGRKPSLAQAAAEAAIPSPDKEPASDKVEFDGIVQEVLPEMQYRMKADNGLGIHAFISKRMLQYYIKILPGDRVTVQVSLYDPSRGVITYRHK